MLKEASLFIQTNKQTKHCLLFKRNSATYANLSPASKKAHHFLIDEWHCTSPGWAPNFSRLTLMHTPGIKGKRREKNDPIRTLTLKTLFCPMGGHYPKTSCCLIISTSYRPQVLQNLAWTWSSNLFLFPFHGSGPKIQWIERPVTAWLIYWKLLIMWEGS